MPPESMGDYIEIAKNKSRKRRRSTDAGSPTTPEKKIITLWVATREIKAHFLLPLSTTPKAK